MIPRRVFFTGNSCSGKSRLIDYITPRLETWGYTVAHLVDRTGLEGAAVYDAQETSGGFTPNTKHLIGDGELSSIVFEYERGGLFHNFRTKLKAAEILNEPKIAMVHAVRDMPQGEHDITFAEWTTGLVVPNDKFEAGREDLLQDSQFLIELLRQNGLYRQSLIIETFAPMEDRSVWNLKRGEHAIKKDEFEKLFVDGDYMPLEEASALGNHYFFFDNSGSNDGQFNLDAEKILHGVIIPRLGLRNRYESGLPYQARR